MTSATRATGRAESEPSEHHNSTRERLASAIESLDSDEQTTLLRLIEHTQASLLSRSRFDLSGLVHESLKADPRFPDRSMMLAQTPTATLTLPETLPTIQQHADCPVFVLPKELEVPGMSLAQALRERRSRSGFEPAPLPLESVSALLYHSYGIREFVGAYGRRQYPMRMSPSAGGLQSIDLYLIVRSVVGLPAGLYAYNPQGPELAQLAAGELHHKLARCAPQPLVGEAPLVLVLASNMRRVQWKYGPRSYRLTHLDAGVLTQSLYLAATALGLDACAVAGFYDDLVNVLVGLDGRAEFAALLFAVGRRAD